MVYSVALEWRARGTERGSTGRPHPGPALPVAPSPHAHPPQIGEDSGALAQCRGAVGPDLESRSAATGAWGWGREVTEGDCGVSDADRGGTVERTTAGHGHGAFFLGEGHLRRGPWPSTVHLGSGTPGRRLGCPEPEPWPSLAGFSSHWEAAASASPTKLGPSGVYGWQSVTSCF